MNKLAICLLLSLTVPLFAVDSGHCHKWLLDSKLGQNDATSASLQQGFDEFELSAHRGEPGNYQVLKDFLADRKLRLQEVYAQVDGALSSAKADYKKQFGRLAWMNPFGAARRHWAQKVAPLVKEQARLLAAIQTLEVLNKAADSSRDLVSQNRLLHEAQTLFEVFYRGYDSRSSAVLTGSLIAFDGDLAPQVSLARKIYGQFEADHSSSTSATLASTLMRMQLTSDEDVAHIAAFHKLFYEEKSDAAAAALAALAFRRNMTVEQARSLSALHESLHSSTSLASHEVIPLVNYFAKKAIVPSQEQVRDIEKVLSKIGEYAVDSAGSSLLLVMLLNTDKAADEDEVRRLLKIFDRMYQFSGVSSQAAAILASAIYLVGDTEEFSKEAMRVWTHLHSKTSADAELCAVMTFKVLAAGRGLVTDIDPTSIEVASLDEDSESIVSITQYAMTGDAFNFDGNPFTKL